jgi:MerR HTH family regulatory protein
VTDGEIDYDRWYPEVPAVMDTKELAELLHTNEQIIRAWVREGMIPAHRRPGGRKFTFSPSRDLRLAHRQPIRTGVTDSALVVERLLRDLGVLALSGLLGDAEHRSNLRPAALRTARQTDRIGEFLVDRITLVRELGDPAQCLSVRKLQVAGVDPVRPLLECLGSVCSRSAHSIHQPFKNFSLAFMAWMIATPSSSLITPTSNGSPVVEGPMNIVTAGSSVWKARQ